MGTILSVVTISVKREGKPTIDIAKAIRCAKCGYTAKRWVIPGRYVEGFNGGNEYVQSPAEALGVTKAMIAKCMGQANYDSFTLDELRAGVVQGVVQRANNAATAYPRPPDNPNRNFEPVSREDGPLF